MSFGELGGSEFGLDRKRLAGRKPGDFGIFEIQCKLTYSVIFFLASAFAFAR